MKGDAYQGFPAVALVALRMFEEGLRGTGRTHRMVKAVEPGDILVFLDEAAMRRFKNEAADIGAVIRDVTMTVCKADPGALHQRIQGMRGRIVFDHEWLLAYFEGSIKEATRALMQVQALYRLPEDPRMPERSYRFEL
jgi:hypothetical protein